MEKTPKQCSLNHHRSQRTKEDAWQDIYSSIGLDDEQVYDQDGLKENYIMWRTPPPPPQNKGGLEKESEREEKKYYCSINFQK